MTRILFWNVQKKDLTPIVCALAKSTEADVVVLNENSVAINSTLNALQTDVACEYYVPVSEPEKRFHCFCRDPRLNMREIHAGLRTSVREFPIGSRKALLALVHGVDPRNYDSETRQSLSQELSGEMRFVKKQQDTNQLIMLGDFNMNPYDRGMNLAAGLNSRMTKKCASAGRPPGVRRLQKKDYDLYYNPMWSLFGDNTNGPAGTIYNTSSQGPYGWSMFDQVLLSHSLVDTFGDVKILTHAEQYCLMNKQGRPDSKNASDHFPILLTLNEEDNE